MKRFVVIISALIFGLNVSAIENQFGNDGLTWHTDFNQAHEISVKTKKPIFAFFTGSDWCGWCIKLQRDVFAKEAFIKWAKEKVVLLELDFPRKKQLQPEQAMQNNSLQQAFSVRGYPTIWIFFSIKDEATNNFTLNALGSLGYPTGAEAGKEEVKFLQDANTILQSQK